MDITAHLTAIASADADDLVRIEAAVAARRKALTSQIAVGDFVELTDVSPRYLEGTVVEVTGRRNSKLLVKADAGPQIHKARARFGESPFGASPSILRPLTETGRRYLDAHQAATSATVTAPASTAPVVTVGAVPAGDAPDPAAPKVGDRFELTNLRPRYLEGTVVEVVSFNITRIVVKLVAGPELARAKERFGDTPTVKPTMLRPVSVETQAFLAALAQAEQTARRIVESDDIDVAA